jgi:hypothetical protein
MDLIEHRSRGNGGTVERWNCETGERLAGAIALKSHLRAVILVVALATTSSACAYGQVQPNSLSQLRSTVHDERRAGFYSLLSVSDAGAASLTFRERMTRFAAFAQQRPEVRRGVIGLLEYENAHPREQVDEDSYHGDLIGAVAELKDPSAVNALMGAINTGGMAAGGLAALGDAAFPAVVAAAERAPTRMSALMTLSRMATLDPAPTLSSENRSRMRRVLLQALGDSNRFYRSAALEGLVAFRDQETRDALARVAAQDPFFVRDEGRVRYPVRETAVAALRKLGASTPKPK